MMSKKHAMEETGLFKIFYDGEIGIGYVMRIEMSFIALHPAKIIDMIFDDITDDMIKTNS
jgi:hypothetical protein